jgi:hypothetical protein
LQPGWREQAPGNGQAPQVVDVQRVRHREPSAGVTGAQASSGHRTTVTTGSNEKRLTAR